MVTELQVIASQLERCVFPKVGRGGVVIPADEPCVVVTGKEYNDEPERSRRPATRSWKRPPDQPRPPGGSWSTGTTAPLLSVEPPDAETVLSEIERAYPDAKIWRNGETAWIVASALVLRSIRRRAVFVVAISDRRRAVKAWGFWDDPIGYLPIWIGPRHTNFPDGSICAFHPLDGTWSYGNSLITLLDLYSVWALRHEHLAQHGRWPGPQVAQFAYERLIECHPDELCGCGSSIKRYRECCWTSDRALDVLVEAAKLNTATNGHFLERFPPDAVLAFVRHESGPPDPNLTDNLIAPTSGVERASIDGDMAKMSMPGGDAAAHSQHNAADADKVRK